MLRIVVSGSGFMGKEVLAAVCREADLEPVGVLEKFAEGDTIALPDGSGSIPMSNDAAALLDATKPDVVIDFSNAAWTPVLALAAVPRGVHLVVGTTGLPEAFLEELDTDCREAGVGAVVAPNFAIGAVLLIHMAKIAAPYFDFAEIIDMHQQNKADAPSGTAIATAQAMVEARGRSFEHTDPDKEPLPGARGAVHEGVALHSQRMPGFVAHQEVTFGGLGQTLKLRHDSVGRDSFIPGVLLATREVVTRRGLVYGLDKLINLTPNPSS